MSSIKKQYLILFIALSIIGFLLPFFLKSNFDSYNSVISIAFTILGTLASIATLLVAILLFDRFGINAKFKEKQVDTVIELVSLLNKLPIHAQSNTINYVVGATQSSESIRFSIPQYKKDFNKTILFSKNFEAKTNNIFEIKESAWLPIDIRNKMDIFDILGLKSVENPFDDQYVRITFKQEIVDEWMQPIPKLTLEMININLHNLYKEIEKWLKNNSNIPIDIKYLK